MNDASKDIAAQFAAAGLVPGELVPQGGVSKVYVDTQDAALQEGINSVSGLAASAQQTANTATQAAGQAQTTAAAANQRADQAFTEAASAFGISEQALEQAQMNAAPSFNRINDIEATEVRTQMFIVAGVGITVTTDPVTKKVTITATGTSTPGLHAASHLTGGSDPIPVATAVADGLMPKESVQDVVNLKRRTVKYVDLQSYGIVADGIVDDSAAFQSLIDVSRDQLLILPPGRYKISNVSFPVNGDFYLRGSGAKLTVFIPATDGQPCFAWDQQFSYYTRYFADLGFVGGAALTSTAFKITRGRQLFVENVYFKDLLYAFDVDQAYKTVIRNVFQEGTVAYRWRSTDPNEFVKDLTISDVQHETANVALAVPWFSFSRVVNGYLNQVTTQSLTGSNTGVYIGGRCEGVFLTDVIIPWPKDGIVLAAEGSDKPFNVQLQNVAIDQFSGWGMVIDGHRTMISNSLFVNGFDRGNTGAGVEILGNTKDTKLTNVIVARNNQDGVRVASGADVVQFNNVTFEENGKVSGVDLLVFGAKYNNPKIKNSKISTWTTPGQILVDGESSNKLLQDVANSTTAANTTETNLKSYTIPANTFKPNQTLRVLSSGLFGVNTNTKTVKMYVGSTVVATMSGAFNAEFFSIECEISYVSLTQQKVLTRINRGSSASVVVNLSVIDTTVDSLIRLTGQNGTATAGDITCYGMEIKIE